MFLNGGSEVNRTFNRTVKREFDPPPKEKKFYSVIKVAYAILYIPTYWVLRVFLG